MSISKLANCTCGKCIEGVMSPRMTYELLCYAGIEHDMLRESIHEEWDDYVAGQKAGAKYNDQLDKFLQLVHIPTYLREETSQLKTFKVGYSNLINYAAGCLRKDKIPTVKGVLAEWQDAGEWPPSTKAYFEKGGKVEYVLDLILTRAEDENYVHGSGEHWSVFHEDIKKLPKCLNDDNLEFMRLAIYDPASGATFAPNGPHYPPNFFNRYPISKEHCEKADKLHREFQERMDNMTDEQKEEMRKIFVHADEVP